MQIKIRKEEENDFEIVNNVLEKILEYNNILDNIYKISEEIKGRELLNMSISHELAMLRDNQISKAEFLNKNNQLLQYANDTLNTTNLTHRLMMGILNSFVLVTIPTRLDLLRRDFDINIK